MREIWDPKRAYHKMSLPDVDVDVDVDVKSVLAFSLGDSHA